MDQKNNNVENEIEQENDQNQDASSSNESSSHEQLALEYKEQWIRAVAETENLRKRFEKEKEDALKYAITKFARDMLSIGDNIQRALSSCEESSSTDMKSIVEGLKLVESECASIFERHGIASVSPLNEPFNPEFHQAMFEIPTPNQDEVGKVAQIIQVGYTLHGRLLRPALVGVYKAS